MLSQKFEVEEATPEEECCGLQWNISASALDLRLLTERKCNSMQAAERKTWRLAINTFILKIKNNPRTKIIDESPAAVKLFCHILTPHFRT